MTTVLVVAITVVAVLLAVLGIASTLAAAADRTACTWPSPAVLEVLLVVQAVLAVVALAGGDAAHGGRDVRRLSGRRRARAGRRVALGDAPSAPGGRAR